MDLEPRPISACEPSHQEDSTTPWEDVLVAAVRIMLRLYLLPFVAAAWLVLKAVTLVWVGMLSLEGLGRRVLRLPRVGTASTVQALTAARSRAGDRPDLAAAGTGLRPKGDTSGLP
jgi:hypothetical protein